MNDEWDEEADLDDEDDGAEPGSGGGEVKNYITIKGHLKLKAEYHKLFHEERPKLVETIAWAASNGDRSENADYIYGKKRLREIDRRLRFLGRRLASAVIVDMVNQDTSTVLFGALVTCEDEDGKKLAYRIVGEDEIDIEKRQISWVSPVAKALLNAKKGDSVIVQRPNGEAELTILKIEYPKDE
jgi:transcription elongation factor GreB